MVDEIQINKSEAPIIHKIQDSIFYYLFEDKCTLNSPVSISEDVLSVYMLVLVPS